MATLDYVDIPPGATRLRSSTLSSTMTTNALPSKNSPSDIRPAPTIFTSLPNPSSITRPQRNPQRQSSISLSASTLTSPTMGFIPQMLLSSAIPGIGNADEVGSAGGQGGIAGSSNPRQNLDPEKYTLLSTKDPLSLPIMTNNFKRFVSKVGPVFWMQDRIEEIFLWKRGWKATCTWMALYTFICFFPRFLILLPHATIIAVILATYPYPPSGQPFSIPNSRDATIQDNPTAQPATEGSIPWQANIQAIQNLMGAVSDLITAAEPYVYHVVLSPSHFKGPPSRATSSTAASQNTPTNNTPVSPYTPHILTLLAVTFPISAFLISLPVFPVRGVCLVAGLAPFAVTNPYLQKLVPCLLSVVREAAEVHGPVVLQRIETCRRGAEIVLSKSVQNWPSTIWGIYRHGLGRGHAHAEPMMKPIPTLIQRVIDNDRLTDSAWNSEMCEVELWENERYGGASGGDANPAPPSNFASDSVWGKSNLRPGERTAWTRGRDGWSGVGVGGTSTASSNPGVEVGGEVSSNLTFSLAPGWAFVETEDWRKDVSGEWAESSGGCDEDGWVYTNDAWLGPRHAPYTAGGGSVTRRRRWTRRVWFDSELARQEGVLGK